MDVRKCPKGEETYRPLFREGAATEEGRPLRDALVVVTEYQGYVAPRKKSVEVSFSQCAFPERTVSMTLGQELAVSNRSQKVFAPDFEEEPSGALRVVPPEGKGDPVKLTPSKPGHFTLVDRMGMYVRTDVWVLLHPLHAVSDQAGRFRIDGIPVGAVTLSSRHSGIGKNAQKKVDVRAGVVTRVDLEIEYRARPHDAGR